MLNPKPQPQDADEDDDESSWEVKAFAEDHAANIMGSTWPPRSYTCIFCRREFRSAQALGGHMNVHRRDRALLHQSQPTTSALLMNPTSSVTATSIPSSTLFIQSRQFPQNGGFCLLYQLPNYNPNWVFGTSQHMNASSIDSPSSTSLPISPSPSMNLMGTIAKPATTSAHDNTNGIEFKEKSSTEELDLELRLGPRASDSIDNILKEKNVEESSQRE